MSHSGRVATSAPAGPTHQPGARAGRASRRTWSVAAFAAAWWQLVVLGVLYVACVRTVAGQDAENALHEQALAERADVGGLLGRVLALTDRLEPPHLVVGIVVVGTLGLLRGRPGRALAGTAVAAVALGLTEVLKLWLLERPDLSERYGEMANSLPSGHTSAVLGLALGACVAAPRLLRVPLALAGAAAATAMGAFVVVEGWHRVSDVLASALVGSIVLCCVLALPTRGVRRRGALAALALLVPAACAAVLAAVYLLGTSTPAAALAAGAVAGLTVLLGAGAVPREVRPGR